MADITVASKLSSLESLDMFQKVTVNIKVIDVKDETQVGGKVRQDVLVTDKSGTVPVTVWEANINSMVKDELLLAKFHGCRSTRA